MSGRSEAAAAAERAGETAFGPAVTARTPVPSLGVDDGSEGRSQTERADANETRTDGGVGVDMDATIQTPIPDPAQASRLSEEAASRTATLLQSTPTTRLGDLNERQGPAADAEASQMDADIVGRTLAGLYRVIGRIGAGGMGVVFEAEHVHLEKHFAIKMLSERAAGQRGGVERLLAEARAASRVDHPHIVDVVNLDTDGGRLFIVMERLEGRSLLERVQEGPLPPAEAVTIARQICSALAAAHAAGVVHRDLKPGNVFLVAGAARGPFIKVLDFGISKSENSDDDLRLTTTGQLIGTPLYISPEQARGAPSIDGRADIYALGVMLFEMLAGRPPFIGRNAFELLFKHGNESPPLLSVFAPELPPALVSLVDRALRKDPEERIQSMRSFDEELASLGDLTAIAAAEPTRLTEAEILAASTSGRDGKSAGGPLSNGRIIALIAAGALVVGAALWISTAQPASTSVSGQAGGGSAVAPVPLSPAGTAGDDSVGTDNTDSTDSTNTTGEVGPTASEADAADRAAPATTSNLTIASDPPGATIHVHTESGEAEYVTPADVEVPTGAPVRLRYTLSGYRPAERTVTPEGDTDVTVMLRRRPLRRGGARSMSNLPIKIQY